MPGNKLEILSIVALAAAACGPAPTGTVALQASGEAAAVDGFPFTEDGETVAFADDWTLSFTKVVFSFSAVTAKDGAGATGFADTRSFVADVHTKELTPVATIEDVPAQRWDRFSFHVGAPGTDVVKAGTVSDADVARLRDAGAGLLLAGTATKGEVGVSFDWAIPLDVDYTDCTNGADGTSGLVVTANSTADATLTIHLDHLFWSSLGSENAALYFGPIAGRASGNAVTLDALATQSLEQPTDTQGAPIQDKDGNTLVYNPGSATPAPANLEEFLHESATRMAHLNGEGLCTVTKR